MATSSLLTSKSAYCQWEWVRGPQNISTSYTYGTKGVSDPSNEPPSRYEAAYWTDLDGNFWLFGGLRVGAPFQFLNDVWKYNPNINEWTWMHGPQLDNNLAGNYGTQGISSPLNIPPGRTWGANCWTDKNGKFWLFGGAIDNLDTYSDLWMFDPAINEWTWMSGAQGIGSPANYGTKGVAASSNQPGTRNECKTGWLKDNKLWFFGGRDDLHKEYNDLWNYDLGTNLWTWVNGPSVPWDQGNYGMLGVPSPSNRPHCRWTHSRWQDEKYFYLFGGSYINSGDYFNDVWRYDPNENEWTWISGTNLVDDLGTFGLQCEANKSFVPISREENTTPIRPNTDNNAFWTFGGFHGPNASDVDPLNDLWIFDMEKLEWILIHGQPQLMNQPVGNYGTMGVPDPMNIPPARGGPCLWVDECENLWMFGGLTGNDPNDGMFSDLWKFTPDSNCYDMLELNSNVIPENHLLCEGDTLEINIGAGSIFISDNQNFYSYDIASGILRLYPSSAMAFNWNIQLASGNSCRPSSGVLNIEFEKKPIARIQSEKDCATLSNASFTFSNASENENSIAWIRAGQIVSNDESFNVSYDSAGFYCVDLVAYNACGTDSTQACVSVLPNIFIPNAFSPNGDGTNDMFRIVTEGDYNVVRFDLYNRWGQRIFSTKQIEVGWDGTHKAKEAEPGVYFYIIEIEKGDENPMKFQGDVTLIR